MNNVIKIEKITQLHDWEQFVAGSNSALKNIYLKHYAILLTTAYYYLKDEEKAKDIVADIFKKLLEMSIKQRKQQLEDVGHNLDTFLKVIVKNKCLDVINIEKNRKRILDGISSLFNRSNNAVSLINEDFKLMLDTLPPRQKEVLEMHLSGYDNNEIAEKLNISYNTARNTLSTSKKRIKKLWTIFMA